MAGIALKIEDLDSAAYFLDGADGTIIDGTTFGAEGHFYFVTRWTKDLAESLCDIAYELLLFENDPDSLMLKAKMEEAQQVRDHIAANYSAEEFKSMQEYMLSPEFRKAAWGAKSGRMSCEASGGASHERRCNQLTKGAS